MVLIGYPVVFPYAIYEQGVLLLAFLLALMAVSWNIISGFAGYVSLGHSVFLGLGAYTGGCSPRSSRSTRSGSCRVGGWSRSSPRRWSAWSSCAPAATPS